MFGVGGFSDKFHSLHTYGLAVDMRGIGRPGSPEAQLWHQIAAKNGVVCPYGPLHRAEWNHCQPTSIKIILADNPLRDTVNAAGPYDLESMFETGRTIIEDVASAAESLSKAAPTPVSALETSATGREPMPQVMASRGTKRRTIVRLALERSADKPARYPQESAGIGIGVGADHRDRGGSANVVGPASETRHPRQRIVKNHRRQRENERHSPPRRQSPTGAWACDTRRSLRSRKADASRNRDADNLRSAARRIG